ncbi:MAG: hypothetical protein HOY69_29820 [Streptomyces sp.]|nr:hypothetical protein [Streptomyces sp.]
MTDTYRDTWISCTEDAIRIRGYYFPWGTKTIPYGSITSARRVPLGPTTGRLRLWGTARPTVWAGLDPGRMGKKEGVILELGRTVRPLVTPSDVPVFMAVLGGHAVPGAVPAGAGVDGEPGGKG